jgi:signal transduction histidine kinase
MESPQPRKLSTYLADDVRDNADDLVETWISEITMHPSLRPIRMLPRDAIRDHIPEVIRTIAESLRTPLEAGPKDVAIRSHARLRYDQGYDIEELFIEHRTLSKIVIDRMSRALERYPGPTDPIEVGRVFSRLSAGLAGISERTASIYRETEVRHQRELHIQLENYIRTITHELKQPLNAIQAGAGLLEEEGRASEPAPRPESLGIIRRGIQRAMSLIDEIRTLAFMEGANQTQPWQSLESCVHPVLAELGDLARRTVVRMDVVQPLPTIDVDTTRVGIALVNLVSNAIKYSDPEKPERWVRVSVERAEPKEAHLWKVTVSDNGLGIPNAFQPQVFERHFRAHPDAAEGTGLGLAITRQVIEQGGGRLWFESEEGKGSAFHFTIPAHLNDMAARPLER